MGLGKTIQTISFVASLMETKNNMGPHIILAPKASMLQLAQWFVHTLRHPPTATVTLLISSLKHA